MELESLKNPSVLAEYCLLDTHGNMCGTTIDFKRSIVDHIIHDTCSINIINRYTGIPVTLLKAWYQLYQQQKLCTSIKEVLFHTYTKVIKPMNRGAFNREVRQACIIYQNRYRHSVDQFRMYYDAVHKNESIYTDFINYDNDDRNVYQYITECITDYIVDNSIEFGCKSRFIPIQYLSINDSLSIIQSRINNLTSLHKKIQYDTESLKTYRVYQFDRIPNDLISLLKIIMVKSPEDHSAILNIFKDNDSDAFLNYLINDTLTREMKIILYRHIVCMDGYFYLVPSHIKHVIHHTNWDWEIANIEDSGIILMNISDDIYNEIELNKSKTVSMFIDSNMQEYITFKHSTYLNLDAYNIDMEDGNRYIDTTETEDFKNHYTRLLDIAIRTNPAISVLDTIW